LVINAHQSCEIYKTNTSRVIQEKKEIGDE
jgi:hypothetical protein